MHSPLQDLQAVQLVVGAEEINAFARVAGEVHGFWVVGGGCGGAIEGDEAVGGEDAVPKGLN